MKQKKYRKPTVQVVQLQQQSYLLINSGETSASLGDSQTAKTEDWD